MSGYLVPISKARKKGEGAQADNQRAAGKAIKTGEAVVDVPVHGPPVPPGTPANKISRRTMMLANPKVIAGGGALLATGAGGAYLYKKRRVEKSLSLMQQDFPSVMMRTS